MASETENPTPESMKEANGFEAKKAESAEEVSASDTHAAESAEEVGAPESKDEAVKPEAESGEAGEPSDAVESPVVDTSRPERPSDVPDAGVTLALDSDAVEPPVFDTSKPERPSDVPDAGETLALDPDDVAVKPQEMSETHTSSAFPNAGETLILEPEAVGLSPDVDNLDAEDSSAKELMRKSLVFEREENRWNAAVGGDLPKIGDHVGHYEILSELGRGGFGAVYRAKNLTLGREEALKLILPSAKDECKDIEKRFEREINIVSRLEHPNIVTLYSSGMLAHHVLWMATELINGERLDNLIQKRGAMTLEEADAIMLPMLSGLMEAHKRKIVHRDLKPANIMLQKDKAGYDEQVIILDFGLAKAIGADNNSALQNLTNYGAKRIYGTPQYMAPEQLKMVEVGTWTDVYSAGLIYFELLTGQCAVQGTTLFDMAYRQNFVEIEFPASFTHASAKEIIKKACAKQPEQRYQDAFEFYEAIRKMEREIELNSPNAAFHAQMTMAGNVNDPHSGMKDQHAVSRTQRIEAPDFSFDLLNEKTVQILSSQIAKKLQASAPTVRFSILDAILASIVLILAAVVLVLLISR